MAYDYSNTAFEAYLKAFVWQYQLNEAQLGYAFPQLQQALLLTNYTDIASIAQWGLPGMATGYAMLGITGVDAAKTTLSLLTIGVLPDANGLTFPDRGYYLKQIGFVIAQFYLASNDQLMTELGVDLVAIRKLATGQRFSALMVALGNYRVMNPGSFSSIFGSVPAIGQVIDNFDAFEAARLGYQSGLLSNPAPIGMYVTRFGALQVGLTPFVLDGTGVNLSHFLNLPPFTQVATGKAIVHAAVNTNTMARFVLVSTAL